MILLRMLKRDVIRTRGTTTVVLLFVFLSALLMASGLNLITTLAGALDGLFETAQVPDVVQMHAGDLDHDALAQWAASNPAVEKFQVVEMISPDGASLYLGTAGGSESESVMDIGLVRQNSEFDLLLDQDNAIYHPGPGEIGVPVYYARRDNLSLGDPVRIRTPGGDRQFVVGAFIRDAQMNPAIIHSKRFVFNETDYHELGRHLPEREYLIEFLLTPAAIDGEDDEGEIVRAFMSAYQETELPQRGPMVDQSLFRILNALSDGIVAAVVVVLSLIVVIIAVLCLRFTILASIEEDYQEIGVMKAIGMNRRHIRRVFMTKYIAVGIVSSAAGYILSFPLSGVLAEAIVENLGTPSATPFRFVPPAAGIALILGIVLLSCMVVLRRLKHISAVEALRAEGAEGRAGSRLLFSLHRFRPFQRLDINVALGIRDVLQRFRLYRLLALIFLFAAFTITVPVHFLSTITSPDFISYMGIGRSDIRVDLRQTEEMGARFETVVSTVQSDTDVDRFAALVTSRFTVLLDTGETESIALETGAVSLFPPDYLEGSSPTRPDEIALSYLNARDMDLGLGDTMVLLIEGDPREMTVNGIYQDVTNGGRTAKAAISPNLDQVLWYSIAIDLAEGVSVAAKSSTYSEAFAPARVTDLAGYLDQTLGTTIARLRTVTVVAVAVGLGIAILITTLFLNMLVRKDRGHITVLRNLGFSLSHIRTQYSTSALTVLAIGIVTGTLFSNTVGQKLMGFLWSFMGAAEIHFVIEPMKAYLLLPLLFVTAVITTTWITVSGIKTTSGGIQ